LALIAKRKDRNACQLRKRIVILGLASNVRKERATGQGQ
jgi:hypothetical protein